MTDPKRSPVSASPRLFRVVPPEAGLTLERWLERRLGAAVSDAAALVSAGSVYIGRARVRAPSRRVASGDRITVYVAAPGAEISSPAPLAIVYRDEDWVIVDKPSGVPVAATRDRADHSLAEQLRVTLEREGVGRPYVGVVHRLDQGASGLVLFTTRAAANPSLHRMFTEHRIERTYRVRVYGSFPAAVVCTTPLLELPSGRGMGTTTPLDPLGIQAETRLACLAIDPLPAAPPDPQDRAPSHTTTSLLEVNLVTGRMHQIRVHAASLGHPVVGDRRYGDDTSGTQLQLHAWRLAFVHPRTGEALHIEGPLPAWAQNGMSSSPGSEGM